MTMERKVLDVIKTMKLEDALSNCESMRFRVISFRSTCLVSMQRMRTSEDLGRGLQPPETDIAEGRKAQVSR